MAAPDIGLVVDILDASYAAAGSAPPSLLQVLKCYESILQRRGIATSADNGVYRLLLAVSLQSPTSWYEKLHREMSRLGMPSDLRLRGRLAEAAMRPPLGSGPPPAPGLPGAPQAQAGFGATSVSRELGTTAGTFTRSSLSTSLADPPGVRRQSSAAPATPLLLAVAPPQPPEPRRPSATPATAAWAPADESHGGGGGSSSSLAGSLVVRPLPDNDYGIRAPDGGSMADFIKFRRKARYFRRFEGGEGGGASGNATGPAPCTSRSQMGRSCGSPVGKAAHRRRDRLDEGRCLPCGE